MRLTIEADTPGELAVAFEAAARHFELGDAERIETTASHGEGRLKAYTRRTKYGLAVFVQRAPVERER